MSMKSMSVGLKLLYPSGTICYGSALATVPVMYNTVNCVAVVCLECLATSASPVRTLTLKSNSRPSVEPSWADEACM